MIQKEKYRGLNDIEIVESRRINGENILTPPEREPLWKLFLKKFEDPIIRILLIAAFISLGISFIHNDFIETIGIFAAIILATGVGFWFETDANRKFDILNQVNDDTKIKVIRNGSFTEISKREIVKGDIIILDTGDEIPADSELLESISLTVNESTLTGELSIEKSINPEEFDKDATYPTNCIYRGTTIIEGHCIARVFAVGDKTEFGKVAEKSTVSSGEETPLNKQLEGLAKMIGVLGFFLAILTFFSLFLKDIFSGEVVYGNDQYLFLGIVILGLITASVRIWMPVFYDGLNMLGVKREMPHKISGISWIIWILSGITTSALLFGIGYLTGITDLNSLISIDVATKILQYFMVAVTLIVVAVPEGLPMSVTLSLALSMRRMLQSNNLVRKMHACETMGAATVICTDKTGTLTQNQMRVSDTVLSGIKDKLEENTESSLIVENISINSTAFLDTSDPLSIKALGNPTESALLLWLHSQGINYINERQNSIIVDQLTFSTERKFMATIVDSARLQRRILYVKGAPEIIAGKSVSVPDDIQELLSGFQNQAKRTLAFAYKFLDVQDKYSFEELTNDGLVFQGIAAISDPVRADVPDAVAKCLNAGIDVKIVTGDTPGTAKEIGRQIGIIKSVEDEKYVITGVDFEALSDEQALDMVLALKIMCRARPSDKQRLVQLLQRKGAVVAVTGDGTNDAPALNFAHVGLSMGTGTSVAKEASDITLLDDSFNSIATAVMWGRSLYRNIQRFLLFQLTINVSALIIVLLGSIFGSELPLTVTQMLWVNLIMDTFAAGALASLPPSEDVMNDKPRRNEDFIITAPMRNIILFTGIAFVIILLGLLYYFTDSDGNISALNLSRFFTIFVMFQFWNMFNAKTFLSGWSAFKNLSKSKGFVLVAMLIVVGQILIVQFGGEVFRTVPLSLRDWALIIAGTSSVLLLGELLRCAAALIKRKRE